MSRRLRLRPRALSGRPIEELTLEAAVRGDLSPADLRVHPDTLRHQAEVAEAHGNPQLGENLRRAAELTALPDDEVLAIYEALRPGGPRPPASRTSPPGSRPPARPCAPRWCAKPRRSTTAAACFGPPEPHRRRHAEQLERRRLPAAVALARRPSPRYRNREGRAVRRLVAPGVASS